MYHEGPPFSTKNTNAPSWGTRVFQRKERWRSASAWHSARRSRSSELARKDVRRSGEREAPNIEIEPLFGDVEKALPSRLKTQMPLHGALVFLSGKRGIRTPGASRLAGFQDRCNRPLYHLSSSEQTSLNRFAARIRRSVVPPLREKAGFFSGYPNTLGFSATP